MIYDNGGVSFCHPVTMGTFLIMKRFSMKKALTLHQHPFKNNYLNICQK